MGSHERRTSRPVHAATLLAAVLACLSAPVAEAQAPLRKIGEMELSLLGVSATVDPLEPVVPKNIASAVRIVVRAGANELSTGDLASFLGPDFAVKGELSGPGLKATLTLPALAEGERLPADPLLLPLPALPVAGDYELANLRIEKKGLPALDVSPSRVPLKVIDQILVTSVKTRALTLDEIRARGVDLSGAENYLGFSFAIGLKLESRVVQIEMPVVFNREGHVVPQPLEPPPAPPRVGGALAPTIVPMLLQPEEQAGPGSGPPPKLEIPGGGGSFSIPALLVIPGDVGFLKQFFSAQLFVANGAPVGSGLVVRDVTGTVNLPLGPDGVRGRDPGNCAEPQKPETCLNDDPLSLPDLVRDGESAPHPETLPVTQVGPDGAPGTADDVGTLRPAEQGMADFTIRGDKEGFHRISFDIRAELLGLPVGAVRIKGTANGGVLVQNAKFKLSFVAPSVVRADEEFTLNVAVTNVSDTAAANLLTLTLPADQISGAVLPIDEPATRAIDTLGPQETAIFEYRLVAGETGQVVASYLSFSTSEAQGELRFKVGVGERGVPLSPDTLALPTSVAGLPPTVVRAAMRVLGHAGTRAVLDATQGGTALYEMIFDVFERRLPHGSAANPFASDQEFFEVIGRLAEESSIDGVPVLIRKVTSLTDDGSGYLVAQGAIFDLYMAKRLAGDGSDFSQVLTFRARFDVGDPGLRLAREPDLLTRCAGCGSLQGIHHENKNWTTPLGGDLENPIVEGLYFRYQDPKVNTLASEFARDILLHGETGFQYYRLNFRNVAEVAAQRDAIRELLLKQFDSPLVKQQIQDLDTLVRFRQAFEDNFDAVVGFF